MSASGLSDEDLPGYCLLHCETPVAAFHKTHISRLLALAGRRDDANKVMQGNDWLHLGPDVIRPIVKQIPGYADIEP